MAGTLAPAAASGAAEPATSEPTSKTRIGYTVATSWMWETFALERYDKETCQDIKMWAEHDRKGIINSPVVVSVNCFDKAATCNGMGYVLSEVSRAEPTWTVPILQEADFLDAIDDADDERIQCIPPHKGSFIILGKGADVWQLLYVTSTSF